MYRAVTWHVLQRGVNVHQPVAVAAAVEQSRIVCDLIDNQSRILIDDHDPTLHLRDDDVNRAVSLVSSVPRVREILVAHMREYAEQRQRRHGRPRHRLRRFPGNAFQILYRRLPGGAGATAAGRRAT